MRTKRHEPKSEFWRKQVHQAEGFEGSATEFCRQRGLNLAPFYSWRKRFRAEVQNQSRSVVRSPFVAVEVLPENRTNRLPDPKWLAEFVRHLSGVQS
jgi:hypothetical protein